MSANAVATEQKATKVRTICRIALSILEQTAQTPHAQKHHTSFVSTGPRRRVFRIRPVLDAVLCAEHCVCRLSGVRHLQTSCQHVPVAGLRVVDDKSHHLHDIQSNVPGRLHSFAALRLPNVSTEWHERQSHWQVFEKRYN